MIRLATPADLSQAADIYEEILDREAQGPVYTNWQRGKYPTIDTARQALEAGTFYVGEENGVLWAVPSSGWTPGRGTCPPTACTPPWATATPERRSSSSWALCGRISTATKRPSESIETQGLFSSANRGLTDFHSPVGGLRAGCLLV